MTKQVGAVKKRHEVNVMNALDKLTAHGWVRLSKDLLRTWYSQDRMSKTIWKDIASKIHEDWSAEDIVVFECKNDIFLMEKAYVKSLNSLT